MIEIVFRGPHGFVTDLGEIPRLRATGSDGTWFADLPRYVVWRFDTVHGESPATHATNDLDDAIAEASRPAGNGQ